MLGDNEGQGARWFTSTANLRTEEVDAEGAVEDGENVNLSASCDQSKLSTLPYCALISECQVESSCAPSCARSCVPSCAARGADAELCRSEDVVQELVPDEAHVKTCLQLAPQLAMHRTHWDLAFCSSPKRTQ